MFEFDKDIIHHIFINVQAVKILKEESKIDNYNLSLLLYADDTALISRSENDMQHMLPGSENGSYGFIRKNPRLFTFIKMKQPLGTYNNLDNNFWTTGFLTNMILK